MVENGEDDDEEEKLLYSYAIRLNLNKYWTGNELWIVWYNWENSVIFRCVSVVLPYTVVCTTNVSCIRTIYPFIRGILYEMEWNMSSNNTSIMFYLYCSFILKLNFKEVFFLSLKSFGKFFICVLDSGFKYLIDDL